MQKRNMFSFRTNDTAGVALGMHLLAVSCFQMRSFLWYKQCVSMIQCAYSALTTLLSEEYCTPYVLHTLALACISFEMDQISIRISLQKDPNFVINFVNFAASRNVELCMANRKMASI
jgi:hypothetical protein